VAIPGQVNWQGQGVEYWKLNEALNDYPSFVPRFTYLGPLCLVTWESLLLAPLASLKASFSTWRTARDVMRKLPVIGDNLRMAPMRKLLSWCLGRKKEYLLKLTWIFSAFFSSDMKRGTENIRPAQRDFDPGIFGELYDSDPRFVSRDVEGTCQDGSKVENFREQSGRGRGAAVQTKDQVVFVRMVATWREHDTFWVSPMIRQTLNG
jgi:hypothetical protein